MNTNETYNYQEELNQGLRNLARMEARREEMAALRAKYAYAETAAYQARCEAAQNNN